MKKIALVLSVVLLFGCAQQNEKIVISNMSSISSLNSLPAVDMPNYCLDGNMRPPLFSACDNKTKLWGFVDNQGDWIIPAKYQYTRAGMYLGADTDYLIVFEAGNYGYIDHQGNWIIEPCYYRASCFQEGIAKVRLEEQLDKEIYIDTKGNEIDPQSMNIGWFSEDLALRYAYPNEEERKRTGDDSIGYVNIEGEWAIVPQFHIENISAGLYCFRNGVAVMQQNGKYGAIDKSGIWIIEPTFDMLEPFYEGYAIAHQGGKLGFIDIKGQWIIEPVYDDVRPFSEGVAAVMVEQDLWGFINPDGNWVIEPFACETYTGRWGKDDELLIFYDGCALVQSQGGFGYINKQGEWICPPNFFVSSSNFYNGLAHVEYVENGISYSGYLNADGEIVIKWGKYWTSGV